MICLSDKEYETVNDCPHSTSQKASPEEMIKEAETLKWSSYAKFLSNYDTVSKSNHQMYYVYSMHSHEQVLIYINWWLIDPSVTIQMINLFLSHDCMLHPKVFKSKIEIMMSYRLLTKVIRLWKMLHVKNIHLM